MGIFGDSPGAFELRLFDGVAHAEAFGEIGCSHREIRISIPCIESTSGVRPRRAHHAKARGWRGGPTSGSRSRTPLIGTRRFGALGWRLSYGSSDGGSCRGMSSDRDSSSVDSDDGGTGVPFSRAARRRPLRATFSRPAVFRTAVLRVAILRPAVVLRVAAFRAMVFRGAVLRAGVLRPAVLRAAVLRVALLRAAVLRAAVLRPVVLRAAVLRVAPLRTVDLRPAVLRAADLRGVVFRAPVLRGRPGLRLLGMTPSLMLFGSVSG